MSDTERVTALEALGVVTSGSEALYREIVALAAQICTAPVALLGFVDEQREWIAGHYRWNVSFLPLETSFGATAVHSAEPGLFVDDAAVDARFRQHPFVVAEPKIRFIASVVVAGPDGKPIGALTVLDRAPRSLSGTQQQMLGSLACQVTAHVAQARRINRLQGEAAVTHDALVESEERFREIFGQVGDLILTVRNDGQIIHANDAAEPMLGIGAQELTKRTIFDLVQPAGRDDFRSRFSSLLSVDEHGLIETTFSDSEGRPVVVEGGVSPKFVNGRAVLARIIFRDISERKRIEVELGQARDAALESARLKSQFLRNVSHEIRTPVHSVNGMLGLLLDSGHLDAEQRELVLSARTSADSLLTILNNILHVARLESGKLSASLSDFDLVTTVERLAEVMRIAADEKGLELHVEFDDGLPAIVRGDASRYRQVVMNLVSNAIKFTLTGRVTLRVSVDRETETHTLVRLSVIDTGIGLSPDEGKSVFDPFTQADASTTREHDGMGLGLTIARQLVDLMGGVISFESAPGQGSTFWFTVPFEKRVADRMAVAGAKQAFPGARVLIYDESEANRKLVHHYVTAWGMRSRFAESAEEAMSRLRTEAQLGDPYRVFIFDGHARGVDAFELARRIRSDEVLSATATVMLAPLGEQVDDAQARSAGLSSYLAKPVDRSELFDCLTIALAREMTRRIDLPEQYTAPVLPAAGALTEDVRRQVRILVAEDKPLNQKLTLSQLRSLGFDADAVSNGSEVIAAVERQRYDVILMDCQMPIMDGYEATLEIRRREGSSSSTKIIAMTANALEGDREKCLAAGMDDYLPKPTKRDQLEAALARALVTRAEAARKS